MPRDTRRTLGAGVVLAVLVALVWGGAGAERLPSLAPIVVTRSFVEYADTVRAKETLSELFARQGIGGTELLAVLAALDGLNPRRVPKGKVFEFATPVGGTAPERVRVRLDDDAFVVAERAAEGWRGSREEITWTINAARVAGTVQSSLYETIDELVPDTMLDRQGRAQLAWDLADEVYAWVIDFTRDIHPGDPFTVAFEYLTSSIGERRYGRILAASVHTARVERTAYVLSDDEGRNAYYDEDGNSLLSCLADASSARPDRVTFEHTLEEDLRQALSQLDVREQRMSYVDFVHAALGNYRCDILDLVDEGNKAFARMLFSGIHQGVFFDYRPTLMRVEWAGAALFSFDQEKIADLLVLGDVHGLLEQLALNKSQQSV